MTASLINPHIALVRFEAIMRRPRTSLAYHATGIRLWVASLGLTGQSQVMLQDRARECYAWANYTRRLELR